MTQQEQIKCNACGEEFPEEFMADKNQVNTGGDTICARCHVECIPEDADAIGEQAKRRQHAAC